MERACREFRKWGIGVMLVSQVLADFVGQIKANINTEIQMKTRDEGDLQRIETKYGKSYIQELVKAPVGSGMVQNSDWNRGKPYYITFRPIMHSVVRLTDEDLEKYNKYNELVDDLAYQLEQLEAEGKDIFDLKLELKLSLDKIKSGSFNMVEIYLEGLRPRIEKLWRDLGKTPKKRESDLVSEEELNAAIKAAKSESEKIKSSDIGQAAVPEKKALGLNDDVPPDKMLKLVNGTLVVKLKALVDELRVLKEDEFKKQVNDDKNDFAAWIREAVGNDVWADMADNILTKEDYIRFLDSLDEGKEKLFKAAVPRTKPFSTKVPAKAAEKDERKAGEDKQKENTAAVMQQDQAQKPGIDSKDMVSDGKKPEHKIPGNQPEITPEIAGTQTKESPKAWPEIKAGIQAISSIDEKISYLRQEAGKIIDNNLFFSIAAEFHRMNDLDDAERYYKKYLESNPDNPKALYYLGSVYNAQKKYPEALDLYNKIVKLQPDYPKVRGYIESINKILGNIAQVK